MNYKNIIIENIHFTTNKFIIKYKNIIINKIK